LIINNTWTICKARQFQNQTYKQIKQATNKEHEVYAIDELVKDWNSKQNSGNLIQGIKLILPKRT